MDGDFIATWALKGLLSDFAVRNLIHLHSHAKGTERLAAWRRLFRDLHVTASSGALCIWSRVNKLINSV